MTEVRAHHAVPTQQSVDRSDIEQQLEQHRRELTGYAYRMLGSAFEAEDAVQETLIRAWRSFDKFEGRSQLRSWLYRIATNVCLDMLSSSQRRARPMDLEPVSRASRMPVPPALPETLWLTPMPDTRVVSEVSDPADIAATRDSIRLAFVAALQHLPARQRAVLIMREVFAWSAAEVAELLDTTVASVNSALQRARATLAAADISETETFAPLDAEQQAMLQRYVDAFERYDVESITALMREDVVMSMPPLPLWLSGREDVAQWLLGSGIGCKGSRLVPIGAANGMPAFAQYKDGGRVPWGVVVLEIVDGQIAGYNTFLDVDRLFPMFGLPMTLAA